MIADGWGDEDELGSLDDGSGIDDNVCRGGGAQVMDTDDDEDDGSGGDAWGFDDDGIVDDDEEEDGGRDNGGDVVAETSERPMIQGAKPPPPPTRREQSAPSAQPPRQQQQTQALPPPQPPQPRRHVTPPLHQLPQQEISDPAASELHGSLLKYLHDLGPTSPLVASLNAVFDAEYSTPEAASELRDYYRDRPELRRYTLEKEVTRMDYRVWVDGGGHCALTGIEEIQGRFGLPDGENEGPGDEVEELLLRASNQSMLADALSAIAGEDRVVRAHSFLASAVARRCFFDVELRKKPILPGGKRKPRGVGIKCELVVSVPAGVGSADDSMGPSRLDLASLELGIKFILEGPRSPRLSYELLDLRPLLDPTDPADAASLRSAALSLARDLASHPVDVGGAPPSPDPTHMSQKAHERLRDNFLSAVAAAGGQTQIGAGLRSAWDQVDAVANVAGKLEFFSGVAAGVAGAFPSLPSAEEMEAAERDAAANVGTGQVGGGDNDNHFSEHAPSGRTFLDRLASSSSAGSGGSGSGRNSSAPIPADKEPSGRTFLDRIAGGGGGMSGAATPTQQEAFPRPPSQQQQSRPAQQQGHQGSVAASLAPPARQESRGRSLLERLTAADTSASRPTGAEGLARFPRPPPPPPRQQRQQQQEVHHAPPGGQRPQMHQTPQQAPQRSLQQQQQARLQLGVGSGLTPAPRQQPHQGQRSITGAGSGLTPAPQQRPSSRGQQGGVGSGLTPAQLPVVGVGSGLTPAARQQQQPLGCFQPPHATTDGVGTGLTPKPLPQQQPQQRGQHMRGRPMEGQGPTTHPQHPHQGQCGSQAQAQAGRQSAPPLIGGFLISGLTRLANAAALPDEAETYGTGMPQRGGPAQQSAAQEREEGLKLYRTGTDIPAVSTAPRQRAPHPPQQQQQAPRPHPTQAQNATAAIATATTGLTSQAAALSEEEEEGASDGGGWSDDDELDLEDEEEGGGGEGIEETDDNDEDENEDSSEPEGLGTEIASYPSASGGDPSRALMASAELSTASGTAALAASMETVNINANGSGSNAASPPASGGAPLAGTIGESGHFVSPPRSPRSALPRAPDTSGSWSEVSESEALSVGGGGGLGPASDFVIVDVSSEDGIIPTRRRWVPRRLRGVTAAASAPGTRGASGGNGGLPGRMIST